MGLPLVPMQLLGGVVDLEYQAEDFLGVEAPAAALADYAGINEWPRWTRDLAAWMVVNHTLSGVHAFLGMPKVVVALEWDGATGYDIVHQYPAAEVITVTRISAGLIKVTRTTAFHGTDQAVACSATLPYEIIPFTATPGVPGKVHGQLYDDGAVYARTTTITYVKRYAATTIAGLVVADGPITIEIYDI